MDSRFSKGEKASVVGAIGNLILSAIKAGIGVISGSTAVLADALHSFSDVLVSTITYIGIRVSRKPPDFEHPYGHYDAEAIAGLLASIVLIIVSFEFLKFSLGGIFQAERTVSELAVVAVFITIAVKEPMARYTFKVASEIRSSVLEVDAHHHRSDVYSSLAVLIGVLGNMAGYRFLDSLVGFAIALYVFKIGIMLIWENIRALLGTLPSGDMLRSIRRAAFSVKGVEGVHNIRVHRLGAFVSVDLHVVVPEDMSLKDAHIIAHRVQRRILKEIPEVVSALVHVEPLDEHHRKHHL